MKAHLLSIANLLVYGLCIGGGASLLAPSASAQNPPSSIAIIVVEGEGMIHQANKPDTHNVAVKIEDDDHHAVGGASVVFALPVTGATGTFTNGATNVTVMSDASGNAVAHGLKTNQIAGKLEIYVTASYRGLRARGLITQYIQGAPNAPVRKTEARTHSSGKWKWVLLGVAAAGGAAGGIYYHNNQQHSAATSPISITTGSILFGSPH